MLMKNPNPIPKFKTIEEEATFWDTHSFADYWDAKKMVKLNYELEPKKSVIHIKVGEGLKEKIERVARTKDISVSALIRMWTVENLRHLSI